VGFVTDCELFSAPPVCQNGPNGECLKPGYPAPPNAQPTASTNRKRVEGEGEGEGEGGAKVRLISKMFFNNIKASIVLCALFNPQRATSLLSHGISFLIFFRLTYE
jgi:hypothetical protein